MFKNLFKRSALSIIRKPSRSIILIVIMFAISSLLFATLAIKNSVSVSQELAKEQLSATVYLSADMEQLRGANPPAGNTAPSAIEIPKITESLVQSIASSKYLKDYTYSLNTSANASDFELVETTQNKREREFQDAFNNMQNQVDEYNSSRPSISAGGMGGNFNFNFNGPNFTQGDTTIYGINAYEFISGVSSGSLQLVDGEAFDEASSDAVLISQELADENSLSVGDTIKLTTTTDDETTKTLAIIGIYQSTEEMFNSNTIYMNIAAAKQFLGEDDREDPVVSNVSYYLNSAADKDAFLADVNDNIVNLSEQNLKLDIDDNAYQTMVGPIENVGSFASTIMWVVVIAAIVIITLIVIINVKDRRYEMGVLMSLGATRVNIVAQVFIELVIVCTVGFALSIPTSQVVASGLSDNLMNSQLSKANEESVEAGPMGGGGRGGFAMTRGMNASSNVQPIEELDINVSWQDYLVLFAFGYGIVILSLIAPSINILRYQPKTILSGKE